MDNLSSYSMATFVTKEPMYNTGKKNAIITRQPTPENANTPNITISEGELVKFKGKDKQEKTGVIKEIGDNVITAFVDSKPVPVDLDTVNRFGGKSRKKKSRKNKSRRYRRV
jgi:hypothetical protein